MTNLEQKALNCRKKILQMSQNGGCFIGAALSCVDTILFLYTTEFELAAIKNKQPDRAKLYLSKGHAVPALYSVFVEVGLMKVDRLKNHLSASDSIYWHPNKDIHGVEFHSGSLGHGLPLGIGAALSHKLQGFSSKVYVICGDGELNEGSIWESLLLAAAKKLDNLVLIIDRNSLQANMFTEDLIPIEPLEDKFKAFGWDVVSCDGHNFEELKTAFGQQKQKPLAIITNTVRGKGLKKLENQPGAWFANFSKEEIEALDQSWT